MAKITQSNSVVSLAAYRGDFKTLLAFDLKTEPARKNLAGFTVQIRPPGKAAYYLWNDLAFEHPNKHFQVQGESPHSTVNAPIHKFRWVHVPGMVHQGLQPSLGVYTYTVTPRYFDANRRLIELDPALSVSVEIEVAPFSKGRLKLGFTRGFVQSQAFVNHFGPRLPGRPKGGPLNFPTSAVAGKNPQGKPFTYAEQYEWLGFTARDRVFEILDEVAADKDLTVDVFAYDLNEPDVVDRLLKLGAEKRVRIILDNAALHHDKTPPKPPKRAKAEDEFEQLFVQAAGADRIVRGRFGRYSHDKVFVVRRRGKATKVLTGSTNFSITGVYVNSNHVLVFDDAGVADIYAQVFDASLTLAQQGRAFAKSPWARAQPYSFAAADLPETRITFSPHQEPAAKAILADMVTRIGQEAAVAGGKGCVLFAVMELEGAPPKPGKPKPPNPVYDALTALHQNQAVFSYGISDNPEGIAYYPVGAATGVLVTGKPVDTQLPKPFSQVPGVGLGHQVHHKFVVCGFNRPDAVVYCGSSNLALGGEQANGDNLLAIHDDEVAAAFAIEAMDLVDHFNFLDHTAKAPKATGQPQPRADKRAAASQAGWFLSTTGAWADKYFDPADLHCKDRVLFAA